MKYSLYVRRNDEYKIEDAMKSNKNGCVLFVWCSDNISCGFEVSGSQALKTFAKK